MSVLLVTGANRGLGLEFVRQYSADGWEVLATSRQPEQSNELKQHAAQHPTVVVHRLDVTDEESVQDLADKLDGKPIDVLLHSSAFTRAKASMLARLITTGGARPWRPIFLG